ncbi:MAG: hypothetical protein SFW67_01920 [Myxococcaceae bacterium]|nr:hypothetical protein [Myxococcaceae bacterium]
MRRLEPVPVLLALSLTALLTATPDERWFPVTGVVGFTAQVQPTGTPTLGLDVQVLTPFGVPRRAEPASEQAGGFVFALGGRGFFGPTPWPQCDWCLSRLSVGPSVRAGYASSSVASPRRIPDFSFWVQASPLYVIERLPDAPLMPGGSRSTFGVRVELGFGAFWWTRQVLRMLGIIVEEGATQVGLITLPLFGLGFINHVGLSWEYSGPAVSVSAHRFGVTVGASL